MTQFTIMSEGQKQTGFSYTWPLLVLRPGTRCPYLPGLRSLLWVLLKRHCDLVGDILSTSPNADLARASKFTAISGHSSKGGGRQIT